MLGLIFSTEPRDWLFGLFCVKCDVKPYISQYKDMMVASNLEVGPVTMTIPR